MWPATALLMPDGRVLLFGGSKEDCTPLPDALVEYVFALVDGSILLLTDKGDDVLALE